LRVVEICAAESSASGESELAAIVRSQAQVAEGERIVAAPTSEVMPARRSFAIFAS
jgi:hypothetical protein